MLAQIASAEAYRKAFDAERIILYPAISEFEQEMGFAVDRSAMEDAAKTLACPLKVNPPNWQHGRIIYAAARRHLVGLARPALALDIGTAKGFSALCLAWALRDAGCGGHVDSVDVIDPTVRAMRNTVAEIDGPKTLGEIFEPWGSLDIDFHCTTGLQWLSQHRNRIDICFIDGKHTGPIVRAEGELLAVRQQRGDLAIFDDMQIEGVAAAVRSLSNLYQLRAIWANPNRGYVIGVRR